MNRRRRGTLGSGQQGRVRTRIAGLALGASLAAGCGQGAVGVQDLTSAPEPTTTTETTVAPVSVPEPVILEPALIDATELAGPVDRPMSEPDIPPDPPVTPAAPVPFTVPFAASAPDPVEPLEPPAMGISEESAPDAPLGGSPLDAGDGVILGAITPDGRPDNGMVDNRHQVDRTLRVYVERELRPMAGDIVAWVREWNIERKTEPRYPYIVSAIYADDCRWRGTGTVTMCAVDDAQMQLVAGKAFTGLAKARSVGVSSRHILGGSSILINTGALAERRIESGFDERRVLFHEFGHVVGLGHQGADSACGPESDAASLMSYCAESKEFDDDDLAALDRLYSH